MHKWFFDAGTCFSTLRLLLRLSFLTVLLSCRLSLSSPLSHPCIWPYPHRWPDEQKAKKRRESDEIPNEKSKTEIGQFLGWWSVAGRQSTWWRRISCKLWGMSQSHGPFYRTFHSCLKKKKKLGHSKWPKKCWKHFPIEQVLLYISPPNSCAQVSLVLKLSK